MTTRLLKIILALCVSMVLISTGAAWALQNCLMGSESAEQLHVAPAELPESSNSTHHHRPPGRIHCPENKIATVSFGPLSAPFRLEPPDDGGGAFLNSRAAGVLPLRFASTGRLSIRPHSSPHLTLSKLRI
jgi:hypothetical protein